MLTSLSKTHLAGARSILLMGLFPMLFFAAQARCQIAGTANIQGTVSDSTGAVIPNASVLLTNEATHVSRNTSSDTAGIYVFPGVPVGRYDLTATAPGFSTYSEIGIVLEVGSSIAINPSLAVGNVATKVEVQAEGLQLQTEDPTFKQTIDQNELTEMPLVSRQMTNLIMLSGGANTAPSNDIVGTKSSYQTISLSIAGGGGNTTIWRLDGGDNQDYMVNGNMPYPFPDSVSQFSVESTVLGAQDGGHVGGMVNVVTRSGTNEFHGTAFEFIRNNYIDATNFFSISPDVLHQNQFGGTFGGPIKRNKLFAFAGYQRTTHTQEQASQEKFVPTAANLQGDFSVTDGPSCEASGKFVQLVDPLTGDQLPGDIYPTPPTYNAQALALVKYLPQPDPAVDTNNCGLVKYAIPLATYDNEFVTRADWTIRTNHNLYGRYFIDGFQQPAYFFPSNILVTTQAGLQQRTQSLVLGDAYTFTPQLVNAAHVTVMRRVDNRGYAPDNINAANLGVDIYQMAKNGLQISAGKWAIGGGTNSNSHFNVNSLTIDDDFTWVRGKHQWVFGGQWVQAQLNIANVYEGNGTFTFNGAYSGSGPNGGSTIGDQNLDFLMGTLSAFEQSKQQQNALRGPFPSLYIQDTYHASARLTLVGGLRWGPNVMPYDYFHRGVVFNQADFLSNTVSTIYPNAPAGVLYYGDKGVPRQFTKNSWLQFSPNFGVSFEPSGKGQTVMRAGAELSYDNPNFFTSQRNQQNPPFATAIANLQTSSSGPLNFSAPWSSGAVPHNPFPQPQVPSPSQAQFFPQSQYIYLPAQFHPAYTIQWTASIQHQFPRGWQAQLDYIGNTTRHNPIGFPVSPAVFIPGNWGPGGTGCSPIVTTGQAAVKPGAAGSPCSTTKNQQSRFVFTIENPNQGNQFKGGGGGSVLVGDSANANYNGMIATLQHRLSSTFSLLTNWTWSKCLNIEDAQGDLAGTTVENPNNPAMDYGPCGSDYRHIVNLSLVARSSFHGMNHLGRMLVNNWELAPLMQAITGAPLNVISGGDVSLTDVGNDRPSLVPGVNPYHKVNISSATGEASRGYLNPAAFAFVCPKNNTAGCAAAGTYGNIGRNAFRTPAYFNIDAQISRTFPIRESLLLDLRLEAFNMLNHPNFQLGSLGSSQNLTSSTFGQISAEAPTGANTSGARIFQGAVKISF